MATRTITTYEHSCDLCEQPCDEANLAHLYGEPGDYPPRAPHPRADICADCQARPVSELLDYFARTRKPSPFDQAGGTTVVGGTTVRVRTR